MRVRTNKTRSVQVCLKSRRSALQGDRYFPDSKARGEKSSIKYFAFADRSRACHLLEVGRRFETLSAINGLLSLYYPTTKSMSVVTTEVVTLVVVEEDWSGAGGPFESPAMATELATSSTHTSAKAFADLSIGTSTSVVT